MNEYKDKELLKSFLLEHFDFTELKNVGLFNKEIKSKANCKACHSDVEKGLIENENIKNLSDFK